MPAITTQTFAEGIKKGMVLANEEFVRKMVWGNDWNLLRISMSCAIQPSGTSNITAARLVVGVVSNTIQGRTYNSTNTTNFIGFLINHAVDGTGVNLTYTANSGNPFFTQSLNRSAMVTRVGNTGSATSFITNNGFASIVTTSGGSVQRRSVLYCDIYRPTAIGSNSANWQQRFASVGTAAGCNVDITKEQIYIDQHENGASAATVTGLLWTDLTTNANVPNESANGNLDSISIFWNQQTFPLEIYELAILRLR